MDKQPMTLQQAVQNIQGVANPNSQLSPAQQLQMQIRQRQEEMANQQQGRVETTQSRLNELSSRPKQGNSGLMVAALADMFKPQTAPGQSQGPSMVQLHQLSQQGKPSPEQEQQMLQRQLMQQQAMADKTQMGLLQGQLQDAQEKEQSNLDYDFKKKLLDQRQAGDLELQKLRNSKPNSSSSSNAFQNEKLKEFGKGAAEFLQKDRPNYLSNLPKIDQTIKLLKGNSNLTGTFTDKLFGDVGLSMRDENAYVAQQNMQSAITDTLRPTLGAQFTEAEGKRIMSLSFDISVSPAENQRRAKALKEVIKNKVQFQDALYKHLAENTDDSSFDYSKYGMMKEGRTPTGKGSKASKLREKYGL